MEQEIQDKLEIEFIDKHGLSNTLEAIADICLLKAEHLRVNWQDDNTARAWETIYNKMNHALATIRNDADILQGLK